MSLKRKNYDYREAGLKRSHGDDGAGQTYVYTHPNKMAARKATIVDYYCCLFQRTSIPTHKQYWCLCAEQLNDPNSEIVQLISEELINIKQFHGVDRDCRKIEKNRERWPEANWYNGEWIDIVKTTGYFDPAIVYLDTINLAITEQLHREICATMSFCKKNTLLVINVELNNAYNGKKFGINDLIKGIIEKITPTERRKWIDLESVYQYRSATERTLMGTYHFRKKKD